MAIEIRIFPFHAILARSTGSFTPILVHISLSHSSCFLFVRLERKIQPGLEQHNVTLNTRTSMHLLNMNSWLATRENSSAIGQLLQNSNFISGKSTGLYEFLPAKSHTGYRFRIRAFARQKSLKKLKRVGQSKDGVVPSSTGNRGLEEKSEVLPDGSPSEDDSVKAVQNAVNIPSRGAVLQACTVTSGLIAALGVVMRQVSHVASMEGLPIRDCSTEVSFGIEMWHLELVLGLVVLISSCRFLLLKTWPDFAESTEAANQRVLSSLQPLDYIVVSFLPGVSEELLFRGALQPLFGMDWTSVLVVAAIFGVLHLGNGRKYSFAIWATFVGIVYGYATILSSSIIVPMASHALNNLVGGMSWRQTSKSLE